MNAEDVAGFLKVNPLFFEDYSDLLAEIYLPHPHGGRAVPLSERQILTLREKNRLLEKKLEELILFGDENDRISEKIHQFSVLLLQHGSTNDERLQAALDFLKTELSIPHAAIRLWSAQTAGEGWTGVSDNIQHLVESLTHPYCGPQVADEVRAWFGEAGSELQSFAQVPLRLNETVGVLVLGSEDAQRFYPDMGTLYLGRLGELVAAALSQT